MVATAGDPDEVVATAGDPDEAVATAGDPDEAGGAILNFSFDDDQRALSDLAKQIFRDASTPERHRAAEATGGFDERLYAAIAHTGLLGACLPESVGGGGQGAIALCAMLEQAGAFTAAVPLFGSVVLGALPLGAAGAESERLKRFSVGACRLTGAFAEAGNDDLHHPFATVSAGRLTAVKTAVHGADAAECFVVSATGEEGPGLYVVDAEHSRVMPQRGTHDAPLGLVHIDGVPARRIGGPAELDQAILLSHLALCALTLGASQRALDMTAKYATERHQFDRPIATFQAVAQRAGDMYIDVAIMRAQVYRAAYLWDTNERPRREILTARALCCGAGHRVVTAAQHIHGGVGFDRDYPLYRLYLSAKQWEFTHGGQNQHFARLGDLLAGPAS